MKYPSVTIEAVCSECGNTTDIQVSQFYPAKISGPPENCYPAEGGEYSTDRCCNCNAQFPDDYLQRLWENAIDAAKADYSDEQYDRWKDEHLDDDSGGDYVDHYEFKLPEDPDADPEY